MLDNFLWTRAGTRPSLRGVDHSLQFQALIPIFWEAVSQSAFYANESRLHWPRICDEARITVPSRGNRERPRGRWIARLHERRLLQEQHAARGVYSYHRPPRRRLSRRVR